MSSARYERLDSGKSVGGQRGSPGIHERLDSGRSSSGLSDALLSPDARRMLPGRQGRFNSVPRSVLACRPAQNVQHLFSAAPACSCAFTDRDKRGACWKLFYQGCMSFSSESRVLVARFYRMSIQKNRPSQALEFVDEAP